MCLEHPHTPPEWATCQKSCPKKWYTAYYFLFIFGKMPNQTLQLTKYLDLGLNFDLFKKESDKVCPLIAKLSV